MNEKYLNEISDSIFNYNDDRDINYQKRFIKDFLEIYKYCHENNNKELFTLNDIIKYKKIYEITLQQNIIDYETLIQIILIYRFSNIDDINNITSKLGYSLEKDLWPTIEYTDENNNSDNENDEENESEENENKDYYIRISPMEKKKYLSHKLSNYDLNMENIKKKMFSLTPQQRLGLVFLMIALKTDLTCIIQGPTASGKSFLMKLFCELFGENPEIIELNNDSGISLLTGQIAPKSEIDDEDIEKIQNILNKCKDNEKLNSIVNKDNFIENTKNWKPKVFRKILNELESVKKDLGEKDLKIVRQIETKFNNELSFLKHLKNQDSPFINALINGKWVILDGIESAQPELFERIISLCDISNKNLNLFEKGPEYEYTLNSENPKFKIHENFRLFITYNPIDVEQSKKLSSSFMSKCLTFFLSTIDRDDKSSALILSGLFNYNQTFEENNNKLEEKIYENEIDKKEPENTKNNEKIKKSNSDLRKKDEHKNINKENKKSRSSSSNSEKPKKEDKKSRSSSSSSEEPKKEDKKSRNSSSSSEKPKKEDKKSRSSSSSSNEEKQKKNDKKNRNSNKDEKKKEITKDKKKESIMNLKRQKIEEVVDEKELEEKRKKMSSIRKFIRELSVRLANIHLSSKNFAKNKIFLFAGQKNFSGRTLKYVYNTIKSRKGNLPEAIISVIEDCYCNSYKIPEEMKNYLIKLFNQKYENYDETMNFLRRDEDDTREKYEPLFNIIDNYMKDLNPFKINVFIDNFNNVLYKDLNEIKEYLKKVIDYLEAKKINNEFNNFFRILYNISNSLMMIEEKEKLKEKKCLEKKIIDPIISRKLNSVKFNQKKYILLPQLFRNNMINLNIKYENYNEYEMKIKKKDEIKNPYFELFTKEGNLISNSICLSLLYPEISNDGLFEDKIKLIRIQNEIVVVVVKLINFSEINKENIFENIEINVLNKLLILSKSSLFNKAFDDEDNKNNFEKIVSDKLVNESNKILAIINSLLDDNLLMNEENYNYVKKIFTNWASKYEDYNSEIIKANYKRKGKEEEGRLKEEFNKLIKKLRSLDESGKNTLINRAIKYLSKSRLSSTSLKNSEKYVDCIIDEFRNIKSEEGKKKAFIKFDIKQTDYYDNYEPQSNFQKVIKSLIEYTDCMNLIEKIKNKDRIISNLNKLDKIINNIKGKNVLKKSFKILRKNNIEDGRQDLTIIQYYKDILLSKLLQEFIQIDESCKYLHLENIYYEFNRFKERGSISDDERKYVSYLTTTLEPTYEIILPQININSILLLFAQKNYKGKSKYGLLFSGNNKNLFKGVEEFINEIEKYQSTDLSKINLIDGLNKLVDICKETLFKKNEQINPLLEEEKKNDILINYIYEKDKEIKIRDTGIKLIIIIIKNFYDSLKKFGLSKAISESNILNFDDSLLNENNLIDRSDEKEEFDKTSIEIEDSRTIINFSDKLEYDDFFFINELNWKENINKKNSKHKYLIYYLFKNPQIEVAIRNYLLDTEVFKNNNKNKFPIYVHLLRVFSSKNELSFQGKTKTYTSNFIEKYLINKIKDKPKKYFINNISWIGLLINNALTISNNFIPNNVSYFYHYLCKLCEIQFTPSSEFEKKYKINLENLIDFMLDSCFKNNFEEIFKLRINDFEEVLKKIKNENPIIKPSKSIKFESKETNEDFIDLALFEESKIKEIEKEEEEESKEEKEIEDKEGQIAKIHYFTHINKIISNELEEKERKSYSIFDKKLREISTEIEPSKDELSKIYDNLIQTIKEEMKIESAKRRDKEIENINKKIYDELEILDNYIDGYKANYEFLKEDLSKNSFNQKAKELIKKQEELKTKYGREIFSSEHIKIIDLSISSSLLSEDVKIIPKDEKSEFIFIEKENLIGNKSFYLPYLYFNAQVILKSGEKTLKSVISIKAINDEKIKEKKLEIKNAKKDISRKDAIYIDIKLSISDKIIKKDLEKDEFLLNIQEISKKISKLMKKISEHLTDKDYIISKIETIKEIIEEFSNISLNDPKFIDGMTELVKTKKICENYETVKSILIKKFELLGEYYSEYRKIIKNIKNDREGVSKAYELKNNIKIVDEKIINFSNFKKNNFNSPYIMLSPDNKNIQTSTSNRSFHFKKCKIIPSLYGNSAFSVNIFSFVNKNLKAEIIKDSIKESEYFELFFVQNYIPASNPIIVSFIIPEKKIEKEENLVLNPCVKLSDPNNNINPIIINIKFFMKFLPLSVIVFSDKLNFYWLKDRLVINKEFIKQGHSLKINFRILNFEGNYEIFENNYTLISLDNNNFEAPIIKYDKEEKSYGKFKIEIPRIDNNTENLCHGLFSLYISNNLIIPIEIKSKIKRNDFDLFYYDIYEGKIINHKNSKMINIYKYNYTEEIKKTLYFDIEYSDQEEHSLEIKLPPYNKHLYFLAPKTKKVIEGLILEIKINIYNYQNYAEYKEFLKICSGKFEIEFVSDGVAKSFFINIQLENIYSDLKAKLLSVPYFIYYNRLFTRITAYNYDMIHSPKKSFHIYHNYDFNSFKEVHKKYYYDYPEHSKLIYYIVDFWRQGHIVWNVTKDDSKLEYFYEYNITDYSKPYLEMAKNNISELYSKYNYFLNSSYHDISTKEKYSYNLEKMKDLIVFICKENVNYEDKLEVLKDLSYYFKNDDLEKDLDKINEYRDSIYLPIVYHNIIFKIGNILKKRKIEIDNFDNDIYSFYQFYLDSIFIEEKKNIFDPKEFKINIRKMIRKDGEMENEEDIRDITSKIWQFNEYSKEPPKKLNIIPNNEMREEELKEGETPFEELCINEDILKNNKIEINKTQTIEQIIDLFKKASSLIQLFPFLIGKINNDEITNIFNNLYSIYITYKKYNKSILSEESIKYCKLFEKICINLKKLKVDLDDYDEIKKLEINEKDIDKSNNLIDYPKPKIINIPKDFRWFKSSKEKSRLEKNKWEAGKMEKDKEEFIIEEKLTSTKKEKKTLNSERTQLKSLLRQSVGIFDVKSEDEEDGDLKEEENEDSDEERDLKFEKETGKIEEVSKEKFDKMKYLKDDKSLTKHVINLMIRNKKSELRLPQLPENNELKPEYFNFIALKGDKKNPSQLLLDLSNIISFKLYQASVKVNTEAEKICAIIAIDCCRTIDKIRKFYLTILAFGMINCFNAMEIPYSVVIFADYQFIYTIKKFEEEHNDEIYKRILDCIMVPRYSTRIADACYYINKRVIHPRITNRRIFIISNGLDPKLKSPEQWSTFFEEEKNKYCFYFIKPEIEKEKQEIILNIWETFKKVTGSEVEIIKDINDIINGDENIYTKFSYVLSEKVILTKDEISTFSKNLNNIERKNYDPQYKEKYDLEKKNLDNVLEYMKYSFDDQDFYLRNKPHIPSNINRLKERDIPLIHPFIVKSINISSLIDEKSIDKLTKFENKGVFLDLVDTIFPPNKPSMYAPSIKGTRLYLVGLVKFIITGGQDNKIWLEKKAGLKRDYRISVIIDSSKSCFNNINSFHSYKTIFSFLKCLSLIDIPYFDLIIATNKEPIILCLGNDTINSLNDKSKLWQALASQLSESNNSKCNIKDCLLQVLKLKSLNLSKKSFTFILTDGYFSNEDKESLSDLISYMEEINISVFGIGLGLYPEKIGNIFQKCFWSSNPNNLLKALSIFYGNEIGHSNKFNIKMKILDLESKLKDISEISDNYGDFITYQKLFAFLENRPFSLESMEETVNRDEADKIEKNPEINENNTMCLPGTFKGLKVLCCCFWSKNIAGSNESDWIDPNYLLRKYSYSCQHCLKDAFDYYGIDFVVRTNYDECIMELQKGGKYYAAWIICGDGKGKLPGGGNANIVGQFIECLNRFWMNGGALVFWCDNEPLTYEANLFLEKAEFPNEFSKSNVRFVGNHFGQREMKGGNIRVKKCGIFNDKRQFEEGKIKRYSLGHNLKKIFEGTTVSFAKIINEDTDEDDLKEEELDEPSIETLLPFIPFAYDHQEGLSVIFYPSGEGDNRGDIIIDGGFSKLFYEIDKTGTYRYVLNVIAWTTQFSKRTVEIGDCWVESFNLASFKYNIRYNENWKRFRTTISNEFDILFLIDATGSMTGEINAAKEQVNNIYNELQSIYNKINFNCGAIFYRDKIDSTSDKNDLFPLTDNMSNLANQIATVKAYGGGDEAEDWVEAYKLATNNIAWREGTKLIIHIADAGAHGKEFSPSDNHNEQGPLLPPYIKKCVDKNIKIVAFKINDSPSNSFKKIRDIYYNYKSTIKDEGQMFNIYEFKRGSTEEISQTFKDYVIKAATVAAPKFK